MSRTARIALGQRSYSLSFAALLLAIGLGLSEVDAQRVPTGFMAAGIEITVLDQPYAIHGNTAQELLDQMRMLGPRGSWASYPYRSEWSYRNRVVLTAGGLESDNCGVEEFEMRFRVEAIYPRWNRPDDAPDELIAAWEGFEELFLTRWEERRRYMIDLAQEASRQARRLEDRCSWLRPLMIELIRDLADRANEDEKEAIAEGARVQLRWPPEGYDELLAEPASLAPPEGGAPLEGAPAPSPAVGGFAGAAASDVRPAGMTGVVAGLQRAGEVEYLESVGFADLEEQEPLTTDAVFRFPAFTEVVVSTLATALAREGLVDLQAPLSSYIPDLDNRLGAISLHHLLSHRSGLDDASPRDSVWSEILDDLDDRAVFTDPGAVFSFSRYDYPLALRALGRSMEGDVIAEASRRVFEPLGMEDTSLGEAQEGLPVFLTTAPDLLRFGSAWIDGEVGGAPSRSTDSDSPALLEVGDRVFTGGVWQDLVGGQTRFSVMCAAGSAGDAAGVQIFPESGVVFVLWSRARGSEKVWPDVATRFLLEGLGADLDVGSDIFEPRRVRGDAQLGTGPRPCEAPSWNDVWVSDPGSPAPAEDWAGRYMNGDRVVELQEREGVLRLMGGMEFEVTHFEDDTYFATLGGQPLYPFRLVRDDAGRRYAVLGDRAHIHDDDRPGN